MEGAPSLRWEKGCRSARLWPELGIGCGYNNRDENPALRSG